MTHKPHPFKPLSAQRLQEMAQIAVTHRQAVPLWVSIKHYFPKTKGGRWAFAPAGGVALAAVLLWAVYAVSLPPTPSTEELITQLDQAEFLVMLEENLY